MYAMRTPTRPNVDSSVTSRVWNPAPTHTPIPATRKALERRDAAEQAYFKIDDAVFIAEQQFMAVLIQVPRAIDRTMFGR